MRQMLVAAGLVVAAVAHPLRAQTVTVTSFAQDTVPAPMASHYTSGLSGATPQGFTVRVVCPAGGGGTPPCDLSLSYASPNVLSDLRWTIQSTSGAGCLTSTGGSDNSLAPGTSILRINGSSNAPNRTCDITLIFKVGGLSWTTHTASLTPYDQIVHFKACKRSVAATPCTPP